MYWLDYSAAKLSGATIRNAGYGGVIRYIDAPDRLRTKHTNLTEYRDHINNGLRVWLVMQNTTTDADGGYSAGQANARRALAGADYLGYTGPIFFCNDRTTVPSPSLWQSYLDGAASILGISRTGAYGFANAIQLARGHANYFWQAGRGRDVIGATLDANGRPVSSTVVNFWQDNNFQPTVGGITCDRNLILKDLTDEGGDDMPLTDADVAKIWGFSARTLDQNAADQSILPMWVWLVGANMGAWAAADKPTPVVDPTTIVQGLVAQLVGPLREELAHLDAVSDSDAAQIADAVARKFADKLGSTPA